ncbi:SpoVK/Ycf46/Vps4 family AAA+-type ATPase [Lachnospiraceae bacterium PF1-21]|uniref:AAA family ATPase n=1 Tax=Ohessyouella blattaphilus TaxID=2949333 RepID=A0ABT1EK67_9FIRM|nr:AAA family ATPase [Ohessyouella blattaphilus]MCP1111083.1 AAA family ATPase [Ohessyouella blattaphilus]MCR8564477.1 AAA family ATPase [Ohessyouella blattaphilus]
MATADQLKSLIKAHNDNDNEKFKTVVLQIAAYEAKLNHDSFARELKKLADKTGSKKANIFNFNQQLANPMLEMSFPNDRLEDLIVSDDIRERIQRILNEYKNRNKLKSYGMSNRRKILIEGKPGTGKTFTASIIASETRLPLYIVQMDKLVTKFMGETSTKLRQIFDSVENSVGVYLFDEFDAIGADRSLDNEVGEMRRILNSFLQFIEQDSSDSIIVAATNNQKLLDQALFRRFDDVLHYPMPTESEVKHLYEYKIASFQSTFAPSKKLVEKSIVLSHAEIIRVCEDAIKESILDNCEITQSKLLSLVEERLRIYNKKEA